MVLQLLQKAQAVLLVAALLISSSTVSAQATVPTVVTNPNYASYGGRGTQKKTLTLPNRGYTLTKVEIGKTSRLVLDGFILTYTPTAGGADVVQRFGYNCAQTIMSSLAITKPVIAVTNVGDEPTLGFIFHHPDGTKTETDTISPRVDVNKDVKMNLCGNFIGMDCYFNSQCPTSPMRRMLDEEHEENFRGRQLPGGFDGTFGCQVYYDKGDLSLVFTQTISNVSMMVGDPSVTTTAWATSFVLNESCGTPTETNTSTYAKNGVALGAIPTFLTYNSILKTFTVAQQTVQTNLGVYTVTINATVTVGTTTSTATSSFTITIISDCTVTKILAPTLMGMAVNVSQSATQDVTFADTIGNQHSNLSWCGARTYTISSSPAATFFSVTGTTFSAQPTLVADANSYTITLSVGLALFPTIAQATQTFNVNVSCSVLSLSFTSVPPASTPITVGITTQPISHSFAVAKTPNCASTVNFTLSPLTGFIRLSTLATSSGSIQIDGATLQDSRTIPYSFKLSADADLATKSALFAVVITDPCSSAAFSIDPIPTINVQVPGSSILQQSYTVTNSFTNLHPTIICNYNPVSLTPEVTYLSFDSQYIFVDQSKVSTANEGTYSFTLTVNSLEYSATATAGNQTVTIKIAVVIDCPNIKLNTSTSIIQPVAYIILLSSHDVQQFAPSSYLVSGTSLIPYCITQCGPLTYSVAQPFVKITPPPSGLTFKDNFTFTVDTQDLSFVGVHNISINVSIANFPSVQASIPAHVTFVHPCQTTRLVSLSLSNMKFQLQSKPTVQEFPEVLDFVGYTTNQPDLCGKRSYRFDKQYPFLKVGPSDSAQHTMEIQLSTIDLSYAGNYTASIVVGLNDYPKVTPISLSFNCMISVPPKNNLPYFETPLPQQLVVTMTERSSQWTYTLPKILDADNDKVTVTVQLGSSSLFVEFNNSTNVFTIPEIQQSAGTAAGSSRRGRALPPLCPGPACPKPSMSPKAPSTPTNSLVKPGYYSWQIQLDDSRDKVQFTIALTVSLPLSMQPVQATDSSKTNQTTAVEPEVTPEELAEEIVQWRENLKLFQTNAQPLSWNLEPPKPFKKAFTQFGKLTIGFSIPIVVAPSLAMIRNGTVSLNQLKSKSQQGQRILEQSDDQVPIMEVTLIPGPQSNATELGYSWSIIHEQEKELSLQLSFDNPAAVSSNPVSPLLANTCQVPDQLHVKFNDLMSFLGENGVLMDESTSLLKLYIPPQSSASRADVAIAGAFESITTFSNAVAQSNFALTIILSGSLNQLWSLVNTQQIIILMGLAYVRFPANAATFLGQIQTIAAFDYVDMSPYINTLLDLEDTQPYSELFDQMGYGSMYFSNNLGTLNLAFLFYLGALPVMKYFENNKHRSKKMKRRYRKLKKLLVHEFPIKTVMESYSNMAVCSFISLHYIRWGTWGESIQTIYGLAFFCLLLAFPFWLIILKIRWIDINDDWKGVGKYAAFYSDISIAKGPKVLLWPLFYLMRRLLLAFIMVYSSETFILQLMVMAYHIVLSIIVLGHLEPFETRFQQRLEMINESCLMLFVYPIICFTPFVSSPERKLELGFICCGIITFNLVLNLGLMLKDSVLELIRLYKLRRFKAVLQLQREAKMHVRGTILTTRRALVQSIVTRADQDQSIDDIERHKKIEEELACIQLFGAREYHKLVVKMEQSSPKEPSSEEPQQPVLIRPLELDKKLFVIQEEPSEFAMNSEQDELELEIFNKQIQLKQPSQQVQVTKSNSDTQLLTRNESQARPKKQRKNQPQHEYFFVYTPSGPIKCKRPIRKTQSNILLEMSTELDQTLAQLEIKNKQQSQRLRGRLHHN